MLTEKQKKKLLLNACRKAKTIIYNLCNGLEKRHPIVLQAILDKPILKATTMTRITNKGNSRK